MFEFMSIKHKSILHSEQEKHFARINLSKHPVLGAEDLREFMNGTAKTLKAPFCLAAAPIIEFVGDADSIRATIKGEFFIFDKATQGNYEEKEDKQTSMQNIANDFLAFIKQYFLRNEDKGNFMANEVTVEFVDNVLTKGYTGAKAYFTVELHTPDFDGDLDNFNE